MNRETILKHSKSIRMYNKALPDFIEVISYVCEQKGHPEHVEGLIQCINTPFIGQEVLNRLLELVEKEFKVFKLTDLKTNRIIDIW